MSRLQGQLSQVFLKSYPRLLAVRKSCHSCHKTAVPEVDKVS